MTATMTAITANALQKIPPSASEAQRFVVDLTEIRRRNLDWTHGLQPVRHLLIL